MAIKHPVKLALKITLIAISLVFSLILSQHALAWGLYIPLESASDLGEEFSGGAAAVNDASTNYLNSAGLVRFKNTQLVISAASVSTHFTFSGTMTNPGLGFPITEAGTASTSPMGIIPAFHYVRPLSEKLALGVSVIAPYGLGLNYQTNALVRYSVIYASQKSIDLSPSLAYRVNPNFSVGAGPDILYYAVKSKNAVRTQPLTNSDSALTNTANSVSYGWHAGILYEFNCNTRAGAAYHSQIVTHSTGQSRFYTSSGLLTPFPIHNTSNNFKITIPLASIVTLSIYQAITPRWALMATADILGWGNYQYDHTYNLATPVAPINTVTPRKLHDACLYAVGTRYQITDQWLGRAGVMYLHGSADNTNRDIFITDPSAGGIGLGAHYQQSKNIGWDFAYAVPVFETVKINHTDTLSGNTLIGRSREKSYGTFAAQLVWDCV